MPLANTASLEEIESSSELYGFDSQGKDKNYSASSIYTLIRKIEGAKVLIYTYSSVVNEDITYNTSGYFFTNNNQAGPSLVTQLVFSKFNAEGEDNTSFFNIINLNKERLTFTITNPKGEAQTINFKVSGVTFIEDHVVLDVDKTSLFETDDFSNDVLYRAQIKEVGTVDPGLNPRASDLPDDLSDLEKETIRSKIGANKQLITDDSINLNPETGEISANVSNYSETFTVADSSTFTLAFEPTNFINTVVEGLDKLLRHEPYTYTSPNQISFDNPLVDGEKVRLTYERFIKQP